QKRDPSGQKAWQPARIGGNTMQLEQLVYGLKITTIGMLIVFSALYVLQLVMNSMRTIFYREPIITPEPEAEVLEHRPEIIAVISAAVATFMGGGKRGSIIAIRKTSEQSSWQQVARYNSIDRTKSH
ncbi:MAG: OadG family protein, partial [bacterium]|nr:OadG family protein [bacterium]